MKYAEAWYELKIWILDEISYEGEGSELQYHLDRVRDEMERLEDVYE